MLLLLLNYLSLFLLIIGLMLTAGGFLLARRRKDNVSPRMKSWLFFWRTIGFWSLVIGGFMIGEKLVGA